MILVDEADPNGREMPFHLPSSANPLVGVTGHAWNDAGGGLTDELKFRLPGGAYTNATIANIVEKGFGDYAYRLTQAQTANAGFAYLYANVPGAQPWSSSEEIGTIASGILVGETVDVRRELAFHLPSAGDPLTPITGHAWVAGEVKLCLPGGVYANADVARVVEKGFGDYALQLTDAQVVAKGKAYLYVDIGATAQPWSAWYELVEATATGPLEAPTISNITPSGGVVPGAPGSFSVIYSAARFTPIEFDLTGIVPGAGITISAKFGHRDETYTILDTTEPLSIDRWKWPFDAYSTIGDLEVEPVHVSLLPRDGWPPVPFKIRVAAIKVAVES